MKLLLLLFVCLALPAAEAPERLDQTFALNPVWRVQTGDDPRWAAPDFDDSGWPRKAPLTGVDGFVWYRQTIQWPPVEGPLTLWIPGVLAAADVYLNGTLSASHGDVHKWWTHRRDPLAPIPIPDAIRRAPQLTISVRVRQVSFGVGLAGISRIGSADAIEQAYQAELLRTYRHILFPLFSSLLPLLTALAAALYWKGRADRIEYLWFALLSAGNLAWSIENTRAIGATQAVAFGRTFIEVAGLYGAWRFFSFGLPPSWLSRPSWVMPCALLLFLLVNFEARAYRIPWIWMPALAAVTQVIFLALNSLDARQRWRQGDRVPLMLLMPHAITILGIVAYYSEIVWVMSARGGLQGSFIFASGLISSPLRIGLTDLGLLSSWIAMAVILARRLLLVVEERQQLSSELEAARQVQALLLPGDAIEIPGLAIERAYLPAQQVGGDFYQIRPLDDGGALVVVGDVSGKGLKAAMLVSVVAGIFRNEASTSPAQVLAALNRGLAGHCGGGFVTCCCARFHPDGRVTLANAGHPAPYCDGREVECEAGLPLGLSVDAGYAEAPVAGGRFTFFSDGVVEAENAQRELFGFERTREISTKSAAEIAEAARAWGQNDDITVVTVRRAVA